MEQYIKKSALVAEVERRLRLVIGMSQSGVGFTKNNPVLEFAISEYKEILSFINTLEVKEVDLNEYINKYFKGWYVDLTDQGNILHTPDGNAGLMSVKEVARHFFELGITVSNKDRKEVEL